MAETAVYKHIVSFYQAVRHNLAISERQRTIKNRKCFLITKHETAVPIMRIPAIAFLYLLGKAEADGQKRTLTFYKVSVLFCPWISSFIENLITCKKGLSHEE